MILDIVQIGNSQGIRIPKSILEECGINKKIDLEVKNNTITIKKLRNEKVYR
jgi:antitoxin MazE